MMLLSVSSSVQVFRPRVLLTPLYTPPELEEEEDCEEEDEDSEEEDSEEDEEEEDSVEDDDDEDSEEEIEESEILEESEPSVEVVDEELLVMVV